MQNVFFSSAPHASTGTIETWRHANRPRHITARPAHDDRMSRNDARDRIVASRLDVTVVHQEQVRDARNRSRASSFRHASGSSDRLPDVITRGRPTSLMSRWCSGV